MPHTLFLTFTTEGTLDDEAEAPDPKKSKVEEEKDSDWGFESDVDLEESLVNDMEALKPPSTQQMQKKMAN